MLFEISLVLAFFMTFLTTMIIVPWLIEKLKQANLTGKDLNKFDRPETPEMGGLATQHF